ncbi:heterokaryon incompatibility protein-domain-containing protein, partial [Xylaria flabelliformis]
MYTYKYQQLDLKNSAFRLVRLLKSTMYDDDIECELIHTTLDDNVISYEAVSYTWGTSSKEYRIKVQGLNFMVTSNLWILLRDLRQANTDRYLWIDAISINQDDDLERGHQVRRMQIIYSSAERVLCYVGQTSESIDIFMNSLVTFQKRASGYRWTPNDSRWKLTWERAQFELQLRYGNDVAAIQKQGLELLLKRPWFRRVWVLQEVASARKASLCCGRNSIPVQIFSASTSVLDADLDSHTRAVLKLMPTYSRKNLRKTRHRDLCQILVDFRRSEASEPHDKIFALLGLCADQSVWEAVVPDYTQTESALVCTTITYI